MSTYGQALMSPDFVNQGAEIGDLARVVAAAWERQEALKGSGG
jgi:hypothetical protein